RAKREVGEDNAGAIVNWFIKNEGLGTKKEYEQMWQMYLSSLAKERQEQQPKPQPVVAPFLQQLAVAPIPPKPGASAPPAVAPIAHEPDASRQAEVDPAQTVVGAKRQTEVRGHVVVRRDDADNLIKHLFISIGDRRSPQAEAFIGKLTTRLQALQTENKPLTVENFLELVGRYANQEFGLVKGAEIARTMAGLSTNNPNNEGSSGNVVRDANKLSLFGGIKWEARINNSLRSHNNTPPTHAYEKLAS